MKWKIAAAAVTAAAIASAPMAAAKPANGNGNGNRPTTPPGQTISAIAKSGGGAAGVLGALVQLKPNNPGLPNALRNATKPKPSPTTSGTPAPTTDTTTPAPTTETTTPAPTTETTTPAPTTETTTETPAP